MPGSWEILEMKKNSLILVIIAPPDLAVSLDFTTAISDLVLPPGSQRGRVGGLPWGPARNQALKMCLDGGFGALAFLDADVRIPVQAFITLMGTNLDIISALYYQRFHPYIPVMFNSGVTEKGEEIRIPVTGWKPGDIVPCDFIPSGATIYRRRVLEAVIAKWPRPFEWGLDIAPIPGENGGPLPKFSEDFQFSWRAKQLGFQPYVHTGIAALHETRAVVGPKWLIPGPTSDPLTGTIGVA